MPLACQFDICVNCRLEKQKVILTQRRKITEKINDIDRN
jgi:hypothetical protein